MPLGLGLRRATVPGRGIRSDESEDGMDLGGRDERSEVFVERQRALLWRMSGGAERISAGDFLFEREWRSGGVEEPRPVQTGDRDQVFPHVAVHGTDSVPA